MSEKINSNNNFYKEIILLKSPANTGKTTSINLAFNLIVNHYSLSGIPLKHPNSSSSYADFQGTFDIVKNKKTYKIGFGSAADSAIDVNYNIDYFRKEKCDICITACRTKGATWHPIQNYAHKDKFNISIIDYISNTATAAVTTNIFTNNQKAQMILDRVIYLI